MKKMLVLIQYACLWIYESEAMVKSENVVIKFSLCEL